SLVGRSVPAWDARAPKTLTVSRTDIQVMSDRIRQRPIQQKSDNSVGDSQEVDVRLPPVCDGGGIPQDKRHRHQKKIGIVSGGKQGRGDHLYLYTSPEIGIQRILLKTTPQ